ncbi:DUF6273 domain-containing protein [uncultured Eubacterium sp.]|uniref:DUF6273 domain-containing protein n=1 Tax=uncultured Eubacterium sp. TaxID=165185 RepID=UPI002804AFDC|nr:DUF6273 domain-containing protein [uncultured Eubacterium sp.]
MARYEKVFTLTPMLYTEDSPVIIEAGALQKDNVNGNVIAQLKFKSISEKVIKALTVKIVALDVSGNPIGEEIEHQYLDLTVQRNENFGSKEAIILSDNTTRAFSVFVTKIVFDDNTNMVLENSEWSELPQQNSIDLDTTEIDYFYKKFSVKNPKQTFRYKDLWLCSCGTINHDSEEKCCCCNNACDEILNIDYEKLKCEAHYKNACDLLSQKSISSVNSAINEFKQISEYKDVEAKLAEAENVLDELNENIYKRKKKRNKIIITTAIIVCVCLVFGVVLKSVIIPSVKYHSEQKQIEFVQEQLKSVSVGDKMRFGTYEQDNDISNGKEDIEWRVLAKENNRILVISDKALDCQLYNVKYDVVTWKTCTLRKWLNDDFFNSAFTDAEKMCIPTVTVSADKNPKYSTYSGKTTKDKIFLLSTKEAEKYFVDDEERKCIPTDYAIAQGVYTSDNHTINGVGTCYWWLRSPGSIQSCATLVYADGVFSERGYDVNRSCSAVRPAMWITIE